MAEAFIVVAHDGVDVLGRLEWIQASVIGRAMAYKVVSGVGGRVLFDGCHGMSEVAFQVLQSAVQLCAAPADKVEAHEEGHVLLGQVRVCELVPVLLVLDEAAGHGESAVAHGII